MDKQTVKYYIEDIADDIKRFARKCLLEISVRLNPRQKWLTVAIGRQFVDKDFIIETTLFQSIIHFWEEDDGEKSMRYQFEAIEGPCGGKALKEEDQQAYLAARKHYAALDRCYRWAKVRDAMWADFYNNYSERKDLAAGERLESEDEHYLTEIVRLRKYMWT